MSLWSDLKLKESSLEASEFCDLGLVASNILSWNAYVDKISRNASRNIGLIKRTCKGLKDVNTLRTSYFGNVPIGVLYYCLVTLHSQKR